MTVWPIYVASWQLECCGEPFAIGDRIAWTVHLGRGPSEAFSVELPRDLASAGPAADGPTGGRRPSGDERPSRAHRPSGGHLFHRGDLNVWIAEPPSHVAGTANPDRRLRGVLCEDHHAEVPEDVPPTRGIVRRIRIVTLGYRPDGRTWRVTADPPTFEDLTRTPSTFEDGFEALKQGIPHRSQTGLLVDVDIDDAVPRA